MGTIINNLLGFGLPGVALAGVVFVGVWNRHTEKRVNKTESRLDCVDTEFKHINDKLDLIVNHFMEKGLGKK